MTTRIIAFVVSMVRVWTRAYTWRLPPHVRDARRAEIESDLFESRRDLGCRLTLAWHVVVRLMLGIPDDLRWRMTYAHVGRTAGFALAALVTTAFLVAAFWWVDLTRARRLPVPPSPAWPASGPPDLPGPVAHEPSNR